MLHLPLEQDPPVGRVKFFGWTQHLQMEETPTMGVPQARWMVYFMDNPIKMDDLGVLHFRKPPALLCSRIVLTLSSVTVRVPLGRTFHIPGHISQTSFGNGQSKLPSCGSCIPRRPHHGGKSCVISGLALQWFRVTGIPSRIMEQALSCPWAEVKKNYVPRTSQKK